jgi:hypothetical protein
MFLGTPFRGTHAELKYSSQVRIAVARAMGGEAAQGLVSHLSHDDEDWGQLKELVQRFQEMVNKRKLRFDIICFYEMETTDLQKVWRDLPATYKEHYEGRGVTAEAIVVSSQPVTIVLSLIG